MSRFRSSGSKDHKILKLGADFYRLSWVVDRYYAKSRLRWPKRYSRDTDRAGAERFAKRWGVKVD